MEKKNLRRTPLFAALWIALVLVLITAGTYAWFSIQTEKTLLPGAAGNGLVKTSRADGVVGSDEIKLLLGTHDGAAFEGLSTTDIAQVNSVEELLPVSTADLSVFFYNPSTVKDNAHGYLPVPEESMYYHGRIYVKIDSERNNPVNVYLFETDGRLAVNADGELLKASRLGLLLNGETPKIFSLDDAASSGRRSNSYIGDTKLEDGTVLAGVTEAVSDPAVPLETVIAQQGGDSGTGYSTPETPLYTLLPGQIYCLDVFFYLEGCDPDCTNMLFENEAELYLGLYAVEK